MLWAVFLLVVLHAVFWLVLSWMLCSDWPLYSPLRSDWPLCSLQVCGDGVLLGAGPGGAAQVPAAGPVPDRVPRRPGRLRVTRPPVVYSPAPENWPDAVYSPTP